MADIRIHRNHHLGLAKARKTAWKWAEAAEEKFGMSCAVLEGETSDTVEFSRPGVEGTLIVTADAFELEARLGFMLSAFRHRIETEIEENLDALLVKSERKPAAKARPAAKKTAAKKK